MNKISRLASIARRIREENAKRLAEALDVLPADLADEIITGPDPVARLTQNLGQPASYVRYRWGRNSPAGRPDKSRDDPGDDTLERAVFELRGGSFAMVHVRMHTRTMLTEPFPTRTRIIVRSAVDERGLPDKLAIEEIAEWAKPPG